MAPADVSGRAARGLSSPQLREPLSRSAAPPGVREHFDGNVRVMTLNIRKLVPASLERREGPDATESLAALRDVAAYIRKKDPDVIVLQELDHDVAGPQSRHGVPAQLDRLAALVGATSKAMAPAQFDRRGNAYDNAILTRNGFTIEDNISVPLAVNTRRGGNTGARSVGVADVVAPDGETHMNVLYTHTSPHAEGAGDRRVQLQQIARIVDDLRDGELSAPDVTRNGERVTLHSARGAATVVGGDLNTDKARADRGLRKGKAGLENIIDGVPAGQRRRAAAGSFIRADGQIGARLDHLYVSRGVDVLRALVEAVEANEVRDRRGVTDHRAVIAAVAID
ncbi:MAG: endonuclease/exonuclease/phosphatase family protein [Myxococcota bacterium]